MKKSILLMLSVFFVLQLYAQDGNFRLGFEATINYADTRAHFNIPRQVLQAPYLNPGGTNGPEFGFSAGFLSQYKLNNWLHLNGRLTFTNLATQIEGRIMYREDAPPFAPNAVSGVVNLYYLDFQIGSKIYFNNSRLKVFIYPYIQGSLYLGNQYQLDLTFSEGQTGKLDSATDNTTNYKDLIFFVGSGIGIEYQFSDRISLDLIPSFEIAFDHYSDAGGDDFFKPANLGVSLGFYYHLK